MPDILFHYERVNPTSWAYLSSLLMLAMYFKFNRIWSVRNIDLFLLIFLAPGLLLVQWAAENMGIKANAEHIQFLGFLWLFVTEGLLLVRLMLDSAMVRRPLLEPNLNAAGLLFLGGSLLFFLMANVVTGEPSAADLSPARQAEVVRAEVAEEHEDEDVQPDNFATDGPGFWLLYRLPRIVTQQSIGAGDPPGEKIPAERDREELLIREATVRVVAILSHVLIVVGLLVVGHWHFENIIAGIAAMTMYLMLPYTALWTGDVEHALPASLLVWAVVLYRRPFLAGMMVGLALGTIYYPAFLLPLWCSFYWFRGLKRFMAGVLLMIAILVITMAITATSTDQFVAHLLQMLGLRLPKTTDLGGIWQTWSSVYRYPVLAAFVALSFSFAIWPTQKNLGTLISGSAVIMLAAQFWQPYDGGIFIAWFLPLLLLTIFRPNLEDRTALNKLSRGWWLEKRLAKQNSL
ncbi:MAG: hypothetical protein GXP24_05985 [Planctomycetes bacterium]|nr:hypothetical protein [Planctomycetota bacterium]